MLSKFSFQQLSHLIYSPSLFSITLLILGLFLYNLNTLNGNYFFVNDLNGTSSSNDTRGFKLLNESTNSTLDNSSESREVSPASHESTRNSTFQNLTTLHQFLNHSTSNITTHQFLNHSTSNLTTPHQFLNHSPPVLTTPHQFLNHSTSNLTNHANQSNSDSEPKFKNKSQNRTGLVNHFKPNKFYPNASSNFIQYSAYRFSPSQVSLIGLVHFYNRDYQTYGLCTWFGNDGKKIKGHLNYTFNVEMILEEVEQLFVCTLHKPTDATGGYLVANINEEDRIVFEEEAGMPQSAVEPMRYNHTYCGAPFHGNINTRAVYEWMEYHRVIMGIDNFIFYSVGPLNQTFYDYVQPYLDVSLLKIIQFEQILDFGVWYYGQVLSNLDCMYQVALESRWVFLHDVDEYLYPVPPYTLSSLLEKFKDKPWLTHGMIQFNTQRCNNLTDDPSSSSSPLSPHRLFAFERMVFREPHVFCMNDECKGIIHGCCFGWKGHRKLIINPRKVFSAAVHSVQYPKDGVNLNPSSELRHYHFRRIITLPSSSYCSIIMLRSDGWWVVDHSLSSTIQRIKSNPIKT